MSIPEKWVIKNCPEVGEWFNKTLKTTTCTAQNHLENSYLHSHNFQNEDLFYQYAGRSFSGTAPRFDFTEITIEQFRKYVINEEETPFVENYDYSIPILKQLNIT